MSRKGENVTSIIPYKKEICFGSKIAEITSMSLEHEIDIHPDEVHGNFIISGEYKSHEVSVNREPFLYKLPFSIELTDRIDLDSLQFDITDFSYDVLNDDTIEVDISFSIEAEELPEEESVEFTDVIDNSVLEEDTLVKEEENRVIETPEEEIVLTQLLEETEEPKEKLPQKA